MDRRRAYLDSSVALRVLLGQPSALPDLSEWALVTSDLMEIESRRTLHRLHVEGKLSDEKLALRIADLGTLLRAVERLSLSRIVLNRASGPMPTSVKTLDAIHLATALLWSESHDESITLLTHDRRLAAAASACGLNVHP